jgi:hypothetical protein
MAYFTNFESIDYDFDGSGINRTITNLAQYSTIITKNIDDVSFYSYYNILDGERPDTVSKNSIILQNIIGHFLSLMIIFKVTGTIGLKDLKLFALLLKMSI